MAILKNTVINDTGFLQLPVGTTAQRPNTPAAGQFRYNTNTNRLEIYTASSNLWQPSTIQNVSAEGGTVYDVTIESNTYRVHVFTNIGNSTFTVSRPGTVEYLIVAGGGGGGGHNGGFFEGGGGGAGGLLAGTVSVTPQAYTVTVGNGGAGGIVSGTQGQNSSAFGLTAIGGGFGGGGSSFGGSGGSGGGSGWTNTTNRDNLVGGGTGTFGQGNVGGSPGGPANAGGGGGGAGERGDTGITGSRGGSGLLTYINGIPVFYAGGGGGGRGFVATGGLGGGGAGQPAAVAGTGTPGTPNTGGGGGGGWNSSASSGSAGGSGIVIIRYLLRSDSNIAARTIINEGLILDFDFSKLASYSGIGSIATDSRQNGITGTLTNNPVFTDARTHRSNFRFNGSNTHISIASIGSITPRTQITVESWVFPRRAPSTGTVRGAAISGEPSHYLGIIDSGDAGATHRLHWALQTSSTRPGSLVGSIPRFAWSYIVGTYDGTRMKAYINGTEVYDVPLTGTISGDGRWMIGAYFPLPTDGTHNWDGEIATAKIYNRALTQAEIINNYNFSRWRFGV